MTRALLTVVLLATTSAFADAGWLSTRTRSTSGPLAQLYAGTDAFGAGIAAPRGSTAVVGELDWRWRDRVGEARVFTVFHFRQGSFAQVAAFVGGTIIGVPQSPADLGLGPQLGISLGLGGQRFWVDLGLQSGMELFARSGTPRFVERAVIALCLQLGHFTASLIARAGADLEPRRNFVGRGEAVLALGWAFGS